MPRNTSRIQEKYQGKIQSISDLTGDAPPSALFPLLAGNLPYLLDDTLETAVPTGGIRWRRICNPVIKKLGRFFLKNPQIMENRNFLRNPMAAGEPDTGIKLPDAPIIWAPNHGFKDDVLASILAAKRHCYILFGSLPQFFNTPDGITSWINGVVMVNRKNTASKKSSVPKAARALALGVDLLMFPEGVWNKSPNEPVLDLWPGIYRIACESGAWVVPIVHYIRDPNNEEKNNPIHTVVDDPIRIDNLSEQEALEKIRDTIATWKWLMMEQYGRTTRAELLRGMESADVAWEVQLKKRVTTTERYDSEIELCADYQPKRKLRPEAVWKSIADIHTPTKSSLPHVLYAKNKIEEETRNYYQRRF